MAICRGCLSSCDALRGRHAPTQVRSFSFQAKNLAIDLTSLFFLPQEGVELQPWDGRDQASLHPPLGHSRCRRRVLLTGYSNWKRNFSMYPKGWNDVTFLLLRQAESDGKLETSTFAYLFPLSAITVRTVPNISAQLHHSHVSPLYIISSASFQPLWL